MTVLERGISNPNGKASVPPPHSPNRRRLLMLAAAALAIVLVAVLIFRTVLAPRIGYITASVVRQDLVQTVTATGTVNPQDTILVGTQVSGTILEQDADFNTVVKKGQILTRLDPTSFQAQLDSAVAAQSQAQSNAAAAAATANSSAQNVLAAHQALASAQSQVAKAKAALYLADVTVQRDRALLSQGYIAQSQFDTDSSNAAAARSAEEAALIAVTQAQAQLQASEAQAQSAAESAVASRQAIDVQSAAVAQARYNFDNAVIRSQVNGTVIARNITIGQTVAASFTTPTLFTIGRDLTKMEVDVAVGEPDIGGVRAGDAVDFTVLAYPNRTFHGVVYQVRKNPTTINNVVTYDTVVYVENKDGALYPGMTANASIHVAKVTKALVVPIAALQWAPPDGQRTRQAGAPLSPWGTTEASLTRTIVAGRNGRIFVMRDGKPTHVSVRVVLVSGTDAAVTPIGATLNPGDTVVTSDTTTQMAAQQSAASSALVRQPTTQTRPGGSH